MSPSGFGSTLLEDLRFVGVVVGITKRLFLSKSI